MCLGARIAAKSVSQKGFEMNKMLNIALAALTVSVTACGSPEPSKQNEVVDDLPESVAQTHSAEGTVDSVSGKVVTISHGPIKSLEWPAMTMPFSANAAAVGSIKAGDRVAFTFSKTGDESVLISIAKQ